jgi:hypothetical protein
MTRDQPGSPRAGIYTDLGSLSAIPARIQRFFDDANARFKAITASSNAGYMLLLL